MRLLCLPTAILSTLMANDKRDNTAPIKSVIDAVMRVDLVDVSLKIVTRPVFMELQRAVDNKNIRALNQWLATNHGKPRDAMYMAIKEGWTAGVKHIIDSGAFKGQYLSYDMIDRAERSPEIEKILENHGFL